MAESREQNRPKSCRELPEDQAAAQSTPRPAESDEEARINQWVQQAQAGDRAAFERLIEHFQDRVWRRARYRIGDYDEAWEVAQEVFILCFRKIHQFRGDAKFWTWLARIVDNQVRNRQGWWRRRRRQTTYSLNDLPARQGEDEPRAWDPPDTGPDPRQQAAGREELGEMDKALQQLSEEHREILLLRFADGLSYEEIAESLEISLGTVKSRINRARGQLRELMKEIL